MHVAVSDVAIGVYGIVLVRDDTKPDVPAVSCSVQVHKKTTPLERRAMLTKIAMLLHRTGEGELVLPEENA